MRLTSFCNLSDHDGYCYTHAEYHHEISSEHEPDELVSIHELYPETMPDGAECPTCGTWMGPCVGGKQHGEVVTPQDADIGVYDERVLGEVPNSHQYGYCVDCKIPCKWSQLHQRWVNWTAAERASWKAERDQEILDRQRAIEASLA